METRRRIPGALRARPAIALYAFIAGVVVAGGLAFGSIPAANGIITGCFNNKTGALRVIDISKAKCAAATETQLKWNQKGAPATQTGLTCTDEQRIKSAAPAFTLSVACAESTTAPIATTSPPPQTTVPSATTSPPPQTTVPIATTSPPPQTTVPSATTSPPPQTTAPTATTRPTPTTGP